MKEEIENARKQGACSSCDQMKKENTNTRKALLETSKQYVEVCNENLGLRRKISQLEKRLYGERY